MVRGRGRLWAVAAVVATALSVAVAMAYVRAPEITPAMRGRAVAAALGCFGCHGPQGLGGVPEPSVPGAIPGWTWGEVDMYLRDEADLRAWILDGAPADWKRAAAAPLVPMPAYRDHLDAQSLSDLIAFFKAASGWAPGMPDAAYEGFKVSQRLGCFGCHGMSGMGGVANPGSFKGHIPAWDGDEFADLVRGDDELRAWILDGRVPRLWNNPAARHFLEAQVTQMPAYRGHLSEAELSAVMAFIAWVRR